MSNILYMHLQNLAKIIFISSKAQLELTTFLGHYVRFCCCVEYLFIKAMRVLMALNMLVPLKNRFEPFLWYISVVLLPKENILLTPRVKFIPIHNYIRYLNLSIVAISVRCHPFMRRRTSIKYIKMLLLWSKECSCQTFIRLELYMQDKLEKCWHHFTYAYISFCILLVLVLSFAHITNVYIDNKLREMKRMPAKKQYPFKEIFE